MNEIRSIPIVWKAIVHGNIMLACGNYSEITKEEMPLIAEEVKKHLDIDVCEAIQKFRDSTGACFSLIILPTGVGPNISIKCQCDKVVWEREY